MIQTVTIGKNPNPISTRDKAIKEYIYIYIMQDTPHFISQFCKDQLTAKSKILNFNSNRYYILQAGILKPTYGFRLEKQSI